MSLESHHTVYATHAVLSCIDHRCTNDLVVAIPAIVGSSEADAWDRYDHFALPGASKGVVQTQKPVWGEAFWEQLDAALHLHPSIRTVSVVDHLRCGAFKLFDPAYAAAAGANDDGALVPFHQASTEAFAKLVRSRYPNLTVERWLLAPCPGSELSWQARYLGDGPSRQPVACGVHDPNPRC